MFSVVTAVIMYIEVNRVRRLKIPNLFFYWTSFVRGCRINPKVSVWEEENANKLEFVIKWY